VIFIFFTIFSQQRNSTPKKEEIMKRLRLLRILLMLTLGTGFSAPGFADDIAMYWGTGTQTDDTNILFMIDNSADMATVVNGQYTRLDIVKEGLANGLKLLMDQENLNVAIGRFTQIGEFPNTPMLFPFTSISEAMTAVHEIKGISVGIVDSSDDAMESITDGSMSLENGGLQVLASGISGPTSPGITTTNFVGTFEQSRVGNTWTYTVRKTSGTEKMTTLTFQSVNCSAIQVTSADFTVDGSSLTWTGETEEANNFVVSFTLDDDYIETSVGVTATDEGNGTGTTTINGPDCSTLVSSAPTGPQKVGLRFSKLNIPQGAYIESATIDFVSLADANAATLTIQAENIDDASTFTSTVSDISKRTTTIASADLITDAWEIGNIYTSNELSSVVQEITNRNGWKCGNSIAFVIEDMSRAALHKFKSIDNGTGLEGPILNVEYSLPTGVTDCSHTSRITLISPLERAAKKMSVPSGSTPPLLKSIEEAENYFRGGAVVNGLNRDGNPLYLVSFQDTYNDGSLTNTTNECGEVHEGGIGNKVPICHVPPTNPANAHTIMVTPSVRDDHLASHVGDTDGVCPSDACESEEIAETPIYTCQGEQPESDTTITICYDDDGDAATAPTTMTILASDWSNYQANALRGICLGDYDIPEGAKQVLICHYPPGNPENMQIVTVSVNAINTHITHHHNDSVYDEDNDCGGDILEVDTDPGVGCSFDGNNCLVVITGPGQTVSADVIDKVTFLSDPGDGTVSPISTLPIGVSVFDDAQTAFIQDIATAGGSGTAQNAPNVLEMKNNVSAASISCFSGSSSANGPVFAAGVSINRMTNRTHNREVYYVFTSPSSKELWEGNLRKFYLVGGAVCETDTYPCPADQTLFDGGFGALAVNYSVVTAGGAGILLESAKRNLSTYVPAISSVYRLEPSATDPEPAGFSDFTFLLNVADDNNDASIDDDNDNVNDGMLGVDTYDIDGDTNITEDRLWLFADTLHTEAKVIDYSYTQIVDTEDEWELETIGVLVATNDGLVHMFDGNGLAEKWAFSPDKLLSKQQEYVNEDCDGDEAHACYGVDSTINILLSDPNKNGVDINDADDVDSVQAFFGLGQGASSGFYALNVTDFSATKPVLDWFINNEVADFVNLGQTWNAPVRALVDPSYCDGVQSPPCNVLLLSGGYDFAELDGGTHGFKFGTSTLGNALYIVESQRDEFGVYSAVKQQRFQSNTDYAIVSEVIAKDMNENGIIDTLYVGNVGGEILRFDLFDYDDDYHTTEETDVVAQLSVAGTVAEDLEINERSFFAAPEVLETSAYGNVVIALSGTRPAASATDYPVEDRLYVFVDDANMATMVDKGDTVTDGINTLDWVDRSVGYSLDSINSVDQLAENGVHGWVMSLDAQEMGIGGPVILVNVPTENAYSVTFNTYNTSTKESRLYMVNLLNGDAIVGKDADGNFDLTTEAVDGVGDTGRYQKLENVPIQGIQAVRLPDGTGELLTSDGPLQFSSGGVIPGQVFIVSPGNWKQER
jgi:hypothetical protein